MAFNLLGKILNDFGITQSELARISKVSLGTISRVVNSVRTPAPQTKAKIVHGINSRTNKNFGIEDVFPDITKPLSLYFDLETIDAKKAADVINILSELYGEKLCIVSTSTLPPLSGSSSEKQNKVA